MAWRNQIANLLSGFLGALIGLFGLLYVQRRAQLEARRGAGRAVLAEMFTNADRALSAMSSLVLHEFTDFAWRQQLPLVAHLLNWEDLKTLVNTYDSAARTFENAREIIDQREKETIRGELTGKQDFGRVRSWFGEVTQELIGAMRILQDAVLDGKESRQLDSDIRKLEATLNSSSNPTNSSPQGIR